MPNPKATPASADSALPPPEDLRESPPSWLAWSVWGVAAIFYLTGFYQRVSPAVMTSELMSSFGIGAKDLGNLSAFYFYTYVAMQIPTGVLVDSWGARKLLIAGSISAAAGTFLFGATGNFALACAGRAIVGGATAVGWLVLLKLATHWFPARRFAMLSGLGLFFGNIGALTAQVPLRLMIEHFGWRAVVLASGAVVLGVCLLAWAFVRNDPAEKQFRSYAPAALHRKDTHNLAALRAGFRKVFEYRNTWLIFFAQGSMVGSILAFTGLWGTPFLKARFGLPPASAAAVCSVMIVCWAVASPVCGALSDRVGRRKPIYMSGCLVATVGWIIMFYVALPLAAFVVVAALTSTACGAVVLGFAYGKESVPVQFLGTISGTINIGNMIGPMLLQPGIGRILDQRWSGQMSNGLRVYGVDAFQTAFLLMVAWLVLACILIGLTRETYCKPTA
ncbi:MAG TPA: MFS transporter [Candidatus Acidoferrales bacterium]|jgi:MFS family permease|nr:MFS transporter [Candidatus Acidoferrales bacterium]